MHASPARASTSDGTRRWERGAHEILYESVLFVQCGVNIHTCHRALAYLHLVLERLARAFGVMHIYKRRVFRMKNGVQGVRTSAQQCIRARFERHDGW